MEAETKAAIAATADACDWGDSLDAIADELLEGHHSARRHSLRVIAKNLRAAHATLCVAGKQRCEAEQVWLDKLKRPQGLACNVSRTYEENMAVVQCIMQAYTEVMPGVIHRCVRAGGWQWEPVRGLPLDFENYVYRLDVPQ